MSKWNRKLTVVGLFLGVLLWLPAFSEAQSLVKTERTLVRCTQYSKSERGVRYNVRLFQNNRNRQTYADIHAVDTYTNYGRSIYVGYVDHGVESQDPLVVNFWTPDRKFILKVPAHYVRGSAIIDYTGAGILNAGNINYYMNCFMVSQP